MAKPTPLKFENVFYWSAGDEANFFRWFDALDCVESCRGRGDVLVVELAGPPSDEELRELLAIHIRYKLSPRQLRPFKTPQNAQWFADPRKDWFADVFGDKSEVQESNA